MKIVEDLLFPCLFHFLPIPSTDLGCCWDEMVRSRLPQAVYRDALRVAEEMYSAYKTEEDVKVPSLTQDGEIVYHTGFMSALRMIVTCHHRGQQSLQYPPASQNAGSSARASVWSYVRAEWALDSKLHVSPNPLSIPSCADPVDAPVYEWASHKTRDEAHLRIWQKEFQQSEKPVLRAVWSELMGILVFRDEERKVHLLVFADIGGLHSTVKGHFLWWNSMRSCQLLSPSPSPSLSRSFCPYTRRMFPRLPEQRLFTA